MGAEQSIIAGKRKVVATSLRSSTQDTKGPVSVPTSPMHHSSISSPSTYSMSTHNQPTSPGFVHDQYVYTPRNFTHLRSSLVSLSGDLTTNNGNRPVNQLTRQNNLLSSSTTSLHNPSSHRTSGIVVVNPGPHRLRSAASLDFSTARSNLSSLSTAEVKHLRRIPMFEPFLPTAQANIQSLRGELSSSHVNLVKSGKSESGALSPTLSDSPVNLDWREVLRLTTRYEEHLYRCAEAAYQKQQAIVVLQKEVDSGVHRLLGGLQSRHSGSPVRSLSGIVHALPSKSQGSASSTTDNAEVALSGQRQLDLMSTRMSEIFSLLECNTRLLEQLTVALNKLNDQLAPDEGRLEELRV